MTNQLDTSDEIVFDRLVDGELSADERRRLLATLDDRPDGWRRCALAFLEAQSWSQEIPRFADDSPAGTVVRKTAAEPSGGSPRISNRHWYAMAASVLIAFMLGLAYGGGNSPPSHLAAAPDLSDANTHQVASDTQPSANPAGRVAAPGDALTLWVQDETGRRQPLRVPLVDAAALDEQYGLEFPAAMPTLVRDQLNERGYQVQSRRRYAPLWLENGRPLVLPVEDTKIVPVSNRVY